nr:hypothetical protein [Micromonospora sp. DSM 115978]
MTTVAAPFKENVGPVSVAVLAASVRAVDPAFRVRAFCHEALDGLDELELKARVRHVAGALDRNLKGRFGHRVYVVVTALDDAARRDELDWWTAWPAVEFVGAAGLGHPGRAL